MAGRVKRKAGLAAAEARAAREQRSEACALCERPLGRRVELHHLVPKSQGGRITAPVHPICHRTIHATLSNAELARDYADPAVLRAHPAIARYLGWIADKPPDFHAPVRRALRFRRPHAGGDPSPAVSKSGRVGRWTPRSRG